ncbi:hypothetical protein GGR95_001689 [Sulfitobacter undariae]|uniref:Uncharacterized protein n=1 Tax=Sulfitobacter undariae TaxID=1563671 RepID=A0A7W6E972_9RHOB|nr:hypothetical protein [Sulfitobacter undariae]MBB3994048.1 hypothetical protein [Sulfitobacter undariae]
MKTFAQNLTSLMPTGITLAPELIEAFDWLEDQGWHRVRDGGQPEDHWLSIYPEDQRNQAGASYVVFGGTTLPFTSHCSAPNPDVDNRIAEIATTAGDGGRAAIWLDEHGKQQFIQLGHDNASIITDDPLVFLQYLAMGYPEPGALEGTDITPLQSALEYHGFGSASDFAPNLSPILPIAFQGFLQNRFNLDIPATARDLGIKDFVEYNDEGTTDPFALWLTSVTPEPTEAELAYEMELMRTIDSLNLQDSDSSETILEKIGTLFNPKD